MRRPAKFISDGLRRPAGTAYETSLNASRLAATDSETTKYKSEILALPFCDIAMHD